MSDNDEEPQVEEENEENNEEQDNDYDFDEDNDNNDDNDDNNDENNEEDNKEEETNDNEPEEEEPEEPEQQEEQEPYYKTYSMQQFFNRVKTVPNTENCYTANFAMKDEVKVDGDILLKALNNENDESGQFEVEFNDETHTFAYIKNSDLDYMSCLRTSGTVEETQKMLGEIDSEWCNQLNDISSDDRKDSDWMSIWSGILSPYATTVKVLKQETETIDE